MSFEQYNNTIIQGNVLEVLRSLPSNFINMIITSPPYWGLRDYGLPDAIWGGNPDCNHNWIENVRHPAGGMGSKGANVGANRNDFANMRDHDVISNTCVKCGAWKGQLGQEPDFHDYIKHLVEIFNEAGRTMVDDGSLWVNLGDSYAGSNQGSGTEKISDKQKSNRGTNYMNTLNHKSILSKIDVRSKSLVGIPDRFKVAMIDSGWICRNEIIWHKPNQMPSSVKDRFTVDFEKFYFFTKNEKYYFEQQLEESEWAKIDKRAETGATLGQKGSQGGYAQNESGKYRKDKMRNMRCVWSINTKPLKEAHFAVYPEGLIETPIKACCPKNGIVLDPFFGSGTSGLSSKKLGRNYIGIDLNPDYIEIARNRIDKVT
jgi:site-specific DNA-methyltransferase (adenine-specific)